MFSQLRTRLLISSLITISIITGLLIFILVERLNLNSEVVRLTQIKNAAGQARELSLYVQYNAHDTNAYTLGHLEHRQEFVEHTAAFADVLTNLQQSIDTGVLEEDEGTALNQIRQIRSVYDTASQDLFVAADANRSAPSEANQAQEDLTWETADQVGDQLDSASQALAAQINDDVERRQDQLVTRNQQVITLITVLGIIITGLILFIQGSAASAVGAPLRALLTGVQQVAAGDLEARVTIQRQDEVGDLATAFNSMTATLQRQTNDLQAQYATAHTARTEAEAARAEVTAQLETIEAQREALREMSVPILPLTATAFVMPLVGALDSARLRLVQEQALHILEGAAARFLILDITGVPVIDTQVAQGLLQVIQAARLLGTEVILVGIRPEVAQTIVGLGIQLDQVIIRSSLQSGIAYVLQERQNLILSN